jgi:hypothetical protein
MPTAILPLIIPLASILAFPPVVLGSASLKNITIVAPAGTSQHGDDHLLCVPSRPWDIIVFFLANYATHALTVRSYPGECLLDLTWGTVAAFLLPTSVMLRGLTAILRVGFFVRGGFWGDPLHIAARSGALCMVVRTKGWKPVAGTELSQVAITSSDPARSVRRFRYVFQTCLMSSR